MVEYSKEADIEKDIELFSKQYFENNEIEKMPRRYKYELGTATKEAILEMDKSFCKGWKSSILENKLRYYEDASGLIMFIQHNLNRMNDLNIIDNMTKGMFDLLTKKIDKQLLSLTNSVRKKSRKRQNVGDDESTGSELNN
jgi:hypothetical protein